MADEIMQVCRANDKVVKLEDDSTWNLIIAYRDLGVHLVNAQGDRSQSELVAAVNARAAKDDRYELSQARASRAMKIASLTDSEITKIYNGLDRVSFSAFLTALSGGKGRAMTPAQKGKAWRKTLDNMSPKDRDAWLKAAGLKLA